MALTFPNNPTTGQLYTAENSIQYRYDGEKWTTVGSSNATAGIYQGDNVSLLTNDANYLASGANISLLTNNAGYITAAQVPAHPSASEHLTSLKTVDGAGSGLDADVLDGQEGSYYLNYNNLSNKPSIPAAAGNGTITVQQGGSTKGTFTVNQGGNTTISLDGGVSGGTIRAWLRFYGYNNATTIQASSNISSIANNATGDWTINFSSAMPDTNYCALASCSGQNDMGSVGARLFQAYTPAPANVVDPSTSSMRLGTSQGNVGSMAAKYVCLAIIR